MHGAEGPEHHNRRLLELFEKLPLHLSKLRSMTSPSNGVVISPSETRSNRSLPAAQPGATNTAFGRLVVSTLDGTTGASNPLYQPQNH